MIMNVVFVIIILLGSILALFIVIVLLIVPFANDSGSSALEAAITAKM